MCKQTHIIKWVRNLKRDVSCVEVDVHGNVRIAKTAPIDLPIERVFPLVHAHVGTGNCGYLPEDEMKKPQAKTFAPRDEDSEVGKPRQQRMVIKSRESEFPPTEELNSPESQASVGDICVETFLAIRLNLWYPNLHRNR